MNYIVIAAIALIVAVAAALFAIYQSSQRRVWVIKIREGNPRLVKGRIGQIVIAELADVLQRNGVQNGTLYGVRRRGMVTLGFSRSVPQSCRQGLRNVWSMHAR